jgi:ABC-2 type transport system ATP-binding protein
LENHSESIISVNERTLISNLTKDSANSKKPLVFIEHLTLEPNTVTSFLGQNGAGKTTAISMIAGLLKPSSGDF